MEKKPIDPERILIREFKITKGQINCPDDFDVHNIESFGYDAQLDLGFNLDERLVRADFSVNVSTVSKQTAEEANGSFHFVYIYHFEDLQDHAVLKDDNAMDCNAYLANAIASITYSTSRGILLSRFQGTAMATFILPVVDPNTLLAKKGRAKKEIV